MDPFQIIALSLVCVAHAEPIIGEIIGGVVNLFNGFKVPGTDVKLLGCFMVLITSSYFITSSISIGFASPIIGNIFGFNPFSLSL